MRTYVINLPRARERRSFMEAQLKSTDLFWEFVDGVDGRALTAAEMSALIDAAAVGRYPTWLTPGAIGCILSHRRVYELVADAGDGPALVLEDDAVVPEDIADLATRIAEHMQPADVVLLEFRSFKPCRLSQAEAVSVGRFHLLSPLDASQLVSTLAYLVAPQAAAAMAAAILPVRWAADSWAEYLDVGAVASLRCVLPRLVRPAPEVRSTVRHGEINGFRDKALDSWPIWQARQLNRRRIAWLMNRVELVD